MTHGAPSVFVVTTALPLENSPLDGSSTTPHGWSVVEHVTVLVDRQEMGGREAVEALGVDVHALLTLEDLLAAAP